MIPTWHNLLMNFIPYYRRLIYFDVRDRTIEHQGSSRHFNFLSNWCHVTYSVRKTSDSWNCNNCFYLRSPTLKFMRLNCQIHCKSKYSVFWRADFSSRFKFFQELLEGFQIDARWHSHQTLDVFWESTNQKLTWNYQFENLSKF